jgi:hypothetical protein
MLANCQGAELFSHNPVQHVWLDMLVAGQLARQPYDVCPPLALGNAVFDN